MENELTYDIATKQIRAHRYAAVRAKTTLDKVPAKVVQLLGETVDYLDSQDIKPTGPGFGVYYSVGDFLVDLEVGYPIDDEIEGNDRVRGGELPTVTALFTTYEGPHKLIPEAHRAVQMWMHEKGVSASAEPVREIYLTDLRDLAEGEDCKAESVWPIEVQPSRAERRRESRK